MSNFLANHIPFLNYSTNKIAPLRDLVADLAIFGFMSHENIVIFIKFIMAETPKKYALVDLNKRVELIKEAEGSPGHTQSLRVLYIVA